MQTLSVNTLNTMSRAAIMNHLTDLARAAGVHLDTFVTNDMGLPTMTFSEAVEQWELTTGSLVTTAYTIQSMLNSAPPATLPVAANDRLPRKCGCGWRVRREAVEENNGCCPRCSEPLAS